MSIFTALVNSVTGLQAQSFAMENISDNIANSQTTGYKRVDTSFQEMVSDFPLNQQVGGSVMSMSRATNNLSGSVRTSGVGTNFALSGPGFVTVRDKLDSTAGVPVFGNTNMYTRRGDFDVDRLGYLVNGAGKYLVGMPIDPVTGNLVGAAPDVVQVNVTLVPARASTEIQYTANLPPTPQTTNYAASVAGSDIWGAAGGVAPATVGPATTPSSASFASNSVSAESVRLYDAKGSPVDVTMRVAKVDSSAAGTTWGLYFDSAQGASTAASTWTRVATLTFDTAGALTAPTGPSVTNMASRGLGNITMDLTGGKLTQFSASSGQGQVDVRQFSQDGYAAGELSKLYVSDDGRVMANFTNGQTQALAQVAIAQFNAANMLKRESGGAFEATTESGAPLFGASGSSLISGSLEGSNTDISEEFSKMIVTQQAYSANTKVMSTAQQMMQDIMNIIR